MRPVRKRIPFGVSVLGELIKVVNFKSEMRQIGADDYRPAMIEFAEPRPEV